MTPCAFCGGPRLNGMPLYETEDGWSMHPPGSRKEFACRSCAKELAIEMQYLYENDTP